MGAAGATAVMGNLPMVRGGLSGRAVHTAIASAAIVTASATTFTCEQFTVFVRIVYVQVRANTNVIMY